MDSDAPFVINLFVEEINTCGLCRLQRTLKYCYIDGKRLSLSVCGECGSRLISGGAVELFISDIGSHK